MNKPTHPSRSSRGSRRRTLSQNLIRDRRAVDQLVQAAQIAPGALVVEIGAGDGAITEQLAASATHVMAYEIDPEFLDRLTRRFDGNPSVEIVDLDIRRAKPPDEPFAVVANVPFSITTDAVNWCLRADRLTSATIITQLQFARKRSGDYGRWTKLTVQAWPRFEWSLAGRVGRHSFRPVPKVDAGILRIVRRPKALIHPLQQPDFERAVEVGFRGKGGSLAASLTELYPKRAVIDALASAGVAADTVVGYVTADQWVRAYKQLPPTRHH